MANKKVTKKVENKNSVKQNKTKKEINNNNAQKGKQNKTKKEINNNIQKAKQNNQNLNKNQKEKKEVKVEKINEKVQDKKTITNSKATPSTVHTDEMSKLIKIIFVLIGIVIIFYGITVVITKNKKKQTNNYNNEITPAVIQYDEIVIGTLLKQKREEYYVLIRDKKDNPYDTLLTYYMSSYQSKTGALKIYNINMDNIFNKRYLADVSNLKVDNIAELRISDLSLVKIKNNQIIETYEGIDAIEKAFKELIK